MTALLLGLAVALADDVRVGVFVGNDEGATGQQDLLFATSDAEKMRDLFVTFGGIDDRDAILLLNRPRRAVEDTFIDVRRRLTAAREQGHRTVLVFYYSGHGDDEALQLGTSALEHDLLRARLETSGADVRLAMLDACQSGSAIRQKGVAPGPSYTFAVAADQVRGTAFLTSSSGSEFSQESQEVGGGLFTYYLHGALLGAADADHDGDVSLTEAYAYVHVGTGFRARGALEAQTPHFDLDLTGSGDLVLTDLETESAWIGFAGDLDGTYSIWDEGRRRYVAEVDGQHPTRVAVAPGTYSVHHRMPGWVDEAVYSVQLGETAAVADVDFLSLAYTETTARGAIEKQVRAAERPDLAVRLAFGKRSFGKDSVFARQYIPGHGVAGVDARWLPRHRNLFYSVDVLSGGGSGTVTFSEAGARDLFVQSTSLGVTVGGATRPNTVRAGAGLKGEVIGFSRFIDDPTTADPDDTLRQGAVTIAPGGTFWVGLEIGRFVMDVDLNLMILPVNWDGRPRRPMYGETLIALGYRF